MSEQGFRKEDFMQPESKRHKRAYPNWTIVAYVFVISIAVDAAFLVSRAGNLSWIFTTLMVLCASLLVGGILFTALAMWRME